MQHQLLQHVLAQNPSVAFPETLITSPIMSNKFSGTYTNLTAIDSDERSLPTIGSNSTIGADSTSRTPSPLQDP